ncbi:MAG: deoxyuridine 5'-triphosphate nucleotidohydrolase [Omnitrophica WOR_2 bacterium RBG_13_44_8]|nr:MAG: deoxyuridine 5'-triphosphate nucleotidohydrolase [Omnitrophica WOR_2 bacterium RBG_13_44_8]
MEQNKNIILKVKKLDPSIPDPVYARVGDAGIDLYSRVDLILPPLSRALVPTGISASIPHGYAGFLQPRSGLAAKFGIGLVNSPGLIDSGYRGEICAVLINTDREENYEIKKGDRICQLVIKKVEHVDIKIVDELDDTERGSGGFGSTGKQ